MEKRGKPEILISAEMYEYALISFRRFCANEIKFAEKHDYFL